MYRNHFDLKLRPDPDIPVWDRLAAVWRGVHRASAKSGVPFAVAFPEWMQGGFTFGKVLRVFVRDTEMADTLYDHLENLPGMDDWVEYGRVRPVRAPERFEAYRMHRIPSGVSKARRTVSLERAIVLQQEARKRMIAQQASLPFVVMQSSSGAKFRLVVERLPATGEENGTPNGYGLSRTTQMVAVPVV